MGQRVLEIMGKSKTIALGGELETGSEFHRLKALAGAASASGFPERNPSHEIRVRVNTCI